MMGASRSDGNSPPRVGRSSCGMFTAPAICISANISGVRMSTISGLSANCRDSWRSLALTESYGFFKFSIIWATNVSFLLGPVSSLFWLAGARSGKCRIIDEAYLKISSGKITTTILSGSSGTNRNAPIKAMPELGPAIMLSSRTTRRHMS